MKFFLGIAVFRWFVEVISVNILPVNIAEGRRKKEEGRR
jgi:hypothetical protein